jgi:hypothetical protein
VGRAPTELVPACTGFHGERVSHHGFAAGRGDRGLDDEAVGRVTAPDLQRILGRQAPMPGMGIEQAAEHRRLVRPRRAPPVDGAVLRHQRRCVPVREEPVVVDAANGHHAPPEGARVALS